MNKLYLNLWIPLVWDKVVDQYTEFRSAIYLNSNVIDDYSYVAIQVFDVDSGEVFIVKQVEVTNDWIESYNVYDRNIENAKIQIRAFTTESARLAIEYLHVTNPLKAEAHCRVGTTTTAYTTTETTMETTTYTTEYTTTETTIDTTTETSTETTTDKTTETPIETTTPDTTTPQPEIGLPARLEVDFNNSTSLLDTFQACHGQYLPQLIIKSYLASTITPFRETSSYHLSNEWEGMSCLETTSVFSLVDSTIIESAIFLNGVWPGAWIEISVVDINTGEREIVERLLTENNWVLLSAEIKGKFSNAQIMITSNINSYSQLAVEYLNVRGGD